MIEDTCLRIGNLGMWNDGLSAIHNILKWDCKASDEIEIKRLESIAEKLSPKSLLDKIHMYVLADKWAFHDLKEFNDDGKLSERMRKKGQEYSRKLGLKLLSTDNELFKSLLTELLSYSGTSSNLFEFGEGCAQGAHKNDELLAMTTSSLEQIPEEERNIDFVCGQINYLSKHNVKLTKTFLDSLISHPALKQHFIRVQLSYTIDSEAIVRIIKALKESTSPIWMYRQLADGRRHEPIPDDQLCDILDLIWQQDGGQEVAINILSMRFHGLQQKQDYIVSDLLKKKSASLLALFDCTEEDNNSIDYELTQIASVCFSGNTNKEYALTILKQIKSKILEHIIARYDHPDFISTIIELHPTLALEVFIGEGTEVGSQIKNVIPFSKVDTKSMLAWCRNNGKDSYPNLASIITPYQSVEKSMEWTPLATELLKGCPEPIRVLDEYLLNLSLTGDEYLSNLSPAGSKAKILKSRLPLFNSLINSENSEISAWGIDKEVQWKNSIASEYEREVKHEIDRDVRFEW